MIDMAEFFDMGGYAAYVWSAYAFATVLLGGLVIESVRRARAAKQTLQALEAQRPRRRRRRKSADVSETASEKGVS